MAQLDSRPLGLSSAAGGATLLIYDWLLCLDREIQYIWKARWSFAKFWFICHRYAMMALVVGMVYGSVKSSSEPSSLEWCKTWDRLSYIATIVIVAAIQGTFVLRVSALYRRSPYLIASLGAAYLACSAVTLVLGFKLQNMLHYYPSSFAPYSACTRTCVGCMRWGIYVYIPGLVIDAAALVNILFFAFGPPAMRPWMNNYMRPLLSSMATRLLLNLHEQVSRTAHYSTDPPTTMNENGANAISTIEFAPIAGERDAESVMYDVKGDGTSSSDRRRTEGFDDERRRFELKDSRETNMEGLRSGLGWVESEGRLTVPGRGQCGPTTVDYV
ncbi:hypothetical protein FRC04_007131 [Tulasnella sp. 424]|nr:hypothetical protein FRC04_007131 [Tulasnella sp. 424]